MVNNQDRCDHVLSSIRRIIRAIDLYSKELVQKSGLTGPQLFVLKELDLLKEVTVGEIAVNIHLSSATVTDVLSRLEKRGLIERRKSNTDRRQVKVKATEAGMELLESAPSLLQDRFIEKFGALQEWEQTQILSTLQRVVMMMEAEDIDASTVLVTGPMTAESETTEKFLCGASSAANVEMNGETNGKT